MATSYPLEPMNIPLFGGESFKDITKDLEMKRSFLFVPVNLKVNDKCPCNGHKEKVGTEDHTVDKQRQRLE